MNCNKFTLAFNDKQDEKMYLKFMADTQSRNFGLFGGIGVLLMLIFHVVLYLYFHGNAEFEYKELLLVPLVYIPLITLITLVCLGFQWATDYIQLLSCLYILFIGPIFIVVKFLFQTNSFFIFATAPFFICVLYCFTYFLRLCFTYCLVTIAIALPCWYTAAVLSWEQVISDLKSKSQVKIS